jgi:hypothetical protein
MLSLLQEMGGNKERIAFVLIYVMFSVSQDSSVGIATAYELATKGLEFEYW